MSVRFLFSVITVLLITLASAQDATQIVYPTTAAASATPLPSGSGYTYAGCYNETTGILDGARALSGGKNSANNSLTASACLAYCAEGFNGTTFDFAGLEYGRECWCGQYLSTYSAVLNDSACHFACNGNSSELCGGQLAISLYNMTSDSKTGVAWSLGGGASWYGTAAVATLLFAALL